MNVMGEESSERRKAMKGLLFLANKKGNFLSSDLEGQEKDERRVRTGTQREDAGEIDNIVERVENIVERVQCTTIHKSESSKRGEDISREKYSLWRQEQKTRAVSLEKQLNSRWELEELIKEQLNRFSTHYNHSSIPTYLKDVAGFLMPRWTPSHELAALYWIGDWRPSAILDLARGLVRSPSSISSSSKSESSDAERLLSQVMHEIRIEEAIIDEEMAEIQATCVLHLPFASLNKKRLDGSALGFIQKEFKKIERVIIKAQQLRLKALELVVKKVLSPTDAAKFFVAFERIQNAIHQVSEQQKLGKVLVTVPTKAFKTS
ncbi:hypothetical protein CUMW_157490 [Citrus unshiu]|nr:hypothetical protein CUMW_157490 [Citrus unshiu]